LRLKDIFFVLFLAAIAITIYFNMSEPSLSADERPAVGYKAPGFSLEALNSNETYTLEGLNKPVVINFWASWCGPCREEAPDLVSFYEEYKGEIEIYAVNMTSTDSLKEIQRFVDQYGFTFPILLDQEGDVGRAYQVIGIPTTFFVDENGHILHKIPGFATYHDLEEGFRRLAGR
jgi:cytochrome c biogenesis protein CcmG/thiol:disulfide interchange protein DsbE